MTEEEIKKRLKKLLTNGRYRHTINVQKIALELAEKLKCSGNIKKKVSLAALLHDSAKCFSRAKSLKIIRANKNKFDELEINIPKIWHTKISDIIARKAFGIKDESILKAIRMHATGGDKMSLVDRIIYIADILDIDKNIKGIEKVKKALNKSIDAAMLEAIRLKISYLVKKGSKIHPNSLKAWNSILAKSLQS